MTLFSYKNWKLIITTEPKDSPPKHPAAHLVEKPIKWNLNKHCGAKDQYWCKVSSECGCEIFNCRWVWVSAMSCLMLMSMHTNYRPDSTVSKASERRRQTLHTIIYCMLVTLVKSVLIVIHLQSDWLTFNAKFHVLLSFLYQFSLWIYILRITIPKMHHNNVSE